MNHTGAKEMCAASKRRTQSYRRSIVNLEVVDLQRYGPAYARNAANAGNGLYDASVTAVRDQKSEPG